MVVILSFSSDIHYRNVMDIAEKIRDIFNNFTESTPPIGIVGNVEGVHNIYNSYRQSLKALDQRYFLGEGQIIHIDDIERSTHIKYFYPSQLMERISDGVALDYKWPDIIEVIEW